MISLEEAQRLVGRGPYHQWLGLQVVAIAEDWFEARAAWREEWMANPERKHTHGGILAALIDLAADNALLFRVGHAVPTKFGNQFSVCEAHVYDQQNNLVASGRGTYYTAEAKK